MNRPSFSPIHRARHPATQTDGSVLIIVLWMAVALVSITLLFGHSMYFEFRASDNRWAGAQAEQAIEGAVRYYTALIHDLEEPGTIPPPEMTLVEQVAVGASLFWALGRDPNATSHIVPVHGLVDEASKLNLNTATLDMLENLPVPGMTPELAAAIIDWRDEDEFPSDGGAESERYLLLDPPYLCKNAPFETIDELRLILGATDEWLYGEDTNRNGVLDPNENDGDVSLPLDNRDGTLDFGILEYVTVYTREGSVRNADGDPRINVSEGGEELQTLLEVAFGATRSAELSGGGRDYEHLLDYFDSSGMTIDEFGQIDHALTIDDEPAHGLININTAPRAVLAAIPGIGLERADDVIAYRLSNPTQLTSAAWITEVLEDDQWQEAAPHITGTTYQFTADIAAVGRGGRGYRRVRVILDAASGEVQTRYRADMAHAGWALGDAIRQRLLDANSTDSRSSRPLSDRR